MNRYLDETLVMIRMQELLAVIQSERRYRDGTHQFGRRNGRLTRAWYRWTLRRKARHALLRQRQYSTSWREEVERIVEASRGE